MTISRTGSSGHLGSAVAVFDPRRSLSTTRSVTARNPVRGIGGDPEQPRMGEDASFCDRAPNRSACGKAGSLNSNEPPPRRCKA